jgi:DNA-binding MarR family transcriptional regulator
MSNQVLSPQASQELTVWVRLLRGYSTLTGELNGRLHEEHGLTINDYEVLLLLSHADERKMRRVDLADEVKLSPSGITRLLDGLQKQGYVERATCESDARVAYAVLTDDGHAKLKNSSGSHIEAIRAELAERYSAEELETLSELLSRLPGAGEDPDPEACAGGD